MVCRASYLPQLPDPNHQRLAAVSTHQADYDREVSMPAMQHSGGLHPGTAHAAFGA